MNRTGEKCKTEDDMTSLFSMEMIVSHYVNTLLLL